jgi:Predicted transcriptional regulator
VIPARLPNGRLAVSTAIVGTVLIAAAAFWLSFTALTDLAHRSGVAAEQAWAWPLIVDGLIVVATVAVVALDRQQAAWYPWLLLMVGTAVSVTANSLHATVAADPSVPAALAGCVAAVPPLVLLASTHLMVVLVRSHRTTPADAEPAAEADEPTVLTVTQAASPTPAGRRELAAGLRRQGWSNKRIARHLGVAPSTVGRWFKEPEAAPDRQDIPKELTA